MNFNSTGNNFGAGQIAFKSHQEENFVVLNAKFSYNPESPEYQAADVLEIYVPDLSIERSAISGVIMRFRDVRDSYGYTWDNSGGTVLKSWVKDKNTLCIEKLQSSRNNPPQKMALTPLQRQSFFSFLANKLHPNLFLLCEMLKFAHT